MHITFRVNSPQVVCETIDGEVVIVHLEKGYYYSLLKTGAEVWRGIERRSNRPSLIHDLAQTYEASSEEIATAVDEFLDKLLHEELILPVEDESGATDCNGKGAVISVKPNPEGTASSLKLPFEKPMLEKFTDMEDLLLLDPIHEVDVEAGWPSAKSA